MRCGRRDELSDDFKRVLFPQVQGENNGSFYQCIKKEDQIEWLANELYNRNKLGLKTVTDDFLRQLVMNLQKRGSMTGEYNYEILTCSKYWDALQYYSLNQHQGVDLVNFFTHHHQSDQIYRMLHLDPQLAIKKFENQE